MKAIIVGGGIGGLTAAIALGRAGVEAQVFERAPELREVGAGVSLWANAIISLDALGVGDAIRRLGLMGGEGGVRKSTGALITSTSYDRLVKQYGAAIVVIHRAELHALLAEHLQPHQLHLGHDCVGFKQDATGVQAQFANGNVVEGDVLIGADGIRGVIRSQLFGASAPLYCGYTAWRCVTNLKGREVPSGESWGKGCRFGIVPLGGDRVYWYATHNEPAGGSDATKEVLLKLFRGWHAPIEALISASEDRSIIRNDIYDRDPLPHWSVGRATLLGDSAHPMSPNLGQGACQAIEDAVELAVSLKNSDSVEAGLTAYERRRIERTGKIVLQARRIGQLGQWENPAACMLRDFLLKMTPRSVSENQLEWVVGYDPLSAEERAVLSKA